MISWGSCLSSLGKMGPIHPPLLPTVPSWVRVLSKQRGGKRPEKLMVPWTCPSRLLVHREVEHACWGGGGRSCPPLHPISTLSAAAPSHPLVLCKFITAFWKRLSLLQLGKPVQKGTAPCAKSPCRQEVRLTLKLRAPGSRTWCGCPSSHGAGPQQGGGLWLSTPCLRPSSAARPPRQGSRPSTCRRRQPSTQSDLHNPEACDWQGGGLGSGRAGPKWNALGKYLGTLRHWRRESSNHQRLLAPNRCLVRVGVIIFLMPSALTS